MSFEVILEITFAFLSNTLLLMGIAVVYSIFPVGIKFNTSYRKIIMGLSVSIVGLTVMSANYELGAGLVFDSRTVVLIISGMFLGTIPTTIATVLMSLYRFYIGGAGTFTGILWIVFASTIGLSWRHLRIKRKKVDHNTITWIELYFFHLGSQIIMILLLFTLPNNQGLEVIQQVLIPILVIYPIGGLLISMFMFQQRKKFFKNVNLVRSEEQYKIIFNKSKSMLMLLDSDSGKIIDANEAAIRKYGYTLNEFKNMEPFELNILVKDEILKYYNKAREQDYNDFLFKHRKKDGSIIDVEIHTGPIILDEKHYVFSTLVDVTEAIKVKQEFDDVDEKLKTIFMSVGEGIIVVNEKGYISLVNNKAITLLNTETDIIGKRITNVFRIHSENNTTSFRDSLDYVLQTNNVFNSDSSYSLSPLDDTNSIIYINFNISPLKLRLCTVLSSQVEFSFAKAPSIYRGP